MCFVQCNKKFNPNVLITPDTASVNNMLGLESAYNAKHAEYQRKAELALHCKLITTETKDGFSINTQPEGDEPAERVGSMIYRYNQAGRHLYVNSIHVEGWAQKSGVSLLLFSHVLLKHPECFSIEGDLGDDNAEVLLAKLDEGLPVEEAVKETPAYKMGSAFGFTEDLEVDGTHLTACRKLDKRLDLAA